MVKLGMSNFGIGEDKEGVMHGSNVRNSARKCRIPLRISSARPRGTLLTTPQAKVVHNMRIVGQRPVRPRSAESRRSESRDSAPGFSGRTDQSPAGNRRLTFLKKPDTDKNKRTANNQKSQKPRKMLNQDAIKEREELELKNNEHCEEDLDSSDDVIKMKSSWLEKVDRFERMKAELDQRQKNILELYAILKSNHRIMNNIGQSVKLPSVDDLSIMNVAKLTPDQLLQLCAGALPQMDDCIVNRPRKNSSTEKITLAKLNEMPSKLIATCEQTLNKRKEIIDWFQSFRSEEKGISTKLLTKKINEFSAENEMLHSSLKTSKMEFLKDLNEIIDYLRKSVNETVAHQLRAEELMKKYKNLSNENEELKKQLQTIESIKLQNNKAKIEDLKSELKEENKQRKILRDKLTRTEGQVKMHTERAAQLETALQLANSQNWNLERTVQQLNEQNEKLQIDFDRELNKLTESIRHTTEHLQEIGDARDKLQTEKEELEQRFQDVSNEYNTSIEKLQEELNSNIDKLLQIEKRCKSEKEERQNAELKLESLCSQLWEAELRHKDVLKQLQEKNDKLKQLLELKNDFDENMKELKAAKCEIEELRTHISQQDEIVKQLEGSLKDAASTEKNLKVELRSKEKYVAELEKNKSLLEQQLHESNHKIESYETQLRILRDQINEVQIEFGKFDNIQQLRDLIRQQKHNLLEVSRQNENLASALQQKELEVEAHLERLTEDESIIEQKNGIIKMLTKKEEEQANIIKLLRNNLEIRTQADASLTEQLAEKNAEIDSLITNIDTRKQQISQLEKIILTLEEQLRKVHLHRRKDQDKITKLEKAIIEYENQAIRTIRNADVPVENIDNLIKILEDEVGAFFEPTEKKLKHEIKRIDKSECPPEGRNNLLNRVERDKVKKGEEDYLKEVIRDNLDRKRAITKIKPTKWLPNIEPVKVYTATTDPDPNKVALIEKIIEPPSTLYQYIKDEKKSKMFKFAGHKL